MFLAVGFVVVIEAAKMQHELSVKGLDVFIRTVITTNKYTVC